MTKLVNRAKMTTASTGTGSPITLGSAVDGYQTFAAAGVANADVVRYVIEDGDAWEIGTGTYTATGTTLSRTVVESSNSDAAINLSGNATVFVTAAAADIVQPGDNISTLTNDAGYTTNIGDITGVTAGAGLAGGGTSGSVTLSHADTSSQSSVNNSGRTFIQDITLDTYGHVTGIVSATDSDTFVGTVTSVNLTAGTGMSVSGGPITSSGSITVTNTAPDQTVVLTQGSNVTITGTYPNFTIAATDTNTTYSAGALLDLSGTTFDVDLSELTDMTVAMAGTDEFVVLDAGAQRRKAANEIGLSIFSNDAGFTTNVGDITGVTAGAGLTGGGTSGDVTLSHADTSSQASLTALTGADVVSDIDVDGFGHVTLLATRALTAADIGAITGNQTITLSGDLSGSGTTSINAQVVANAIGANELNVTGNGTTAQFLRSDGDGSFTWATPTDTNTTYSAGTGLSLVGTTFNNTAPDQVVSLTGGGATSISGTYPNFTISSTDTNTTYSAGSGIGLSGTTFSVAAGGGLTQDASGLSHADTSSQPSVDNSGSVYIQDITLDTYGHVTGITSTTVPASAPSTAQVLTAIAGSTAGAVGTYAWVQYMTVTDTDIAANGTVAGSALRYAGMTYRTDAWIQTAISSTLSGTWRAMGFFSQDDSSLDTFGLSLVVRIS